MLLSSGKGHKSPPVLAEFGMFDFHFGFLGNR